MISIYQLLKNLTNSSVYISLLVGFAILFVKNTSKTVIFIKIYFFIMALLELYADLHRLFFKGTTEFLFPVYAFLEVTLVSIVLYFFLNNELLKKKLVKIIIAVSICCIATLIVNVFFLQEIGLATTVMSLPILCCCFVIFYSLLEVDLTNKLPIVFIIYLFLMHGVAVIIHLFYNPIMSLSKTQIINIFVIRVIVFILAKTIVLTYLTNVLILKKKLSPDVQ